MEGIPELLAEAASDRWTFTGDLALDNLVARMAHALTQLQSERDEADKTRVSRDRLLQERDYLQSALTACQARLGKAEELLAKKAADEGHGPSAYQDWCDRRDAFLSPTQEAKPPEPTLAPCPVCGAGPCHVARKRNKGRVTWKVPLACVQSIDDMQVGYYPTGNEVLS